MVRSHTVTSYAATVPSKKSHQEEKLVNPSFGQSSVYCYTTAISGYIRLGLLSFKVLFPKQNQLF